MPGIQFGRFAPTVTVPEGAILRSTGALTATITSRATGDHVTVVLRCSRKTDGPTKWPTVPFEQATHIFVDDFDGEEIATFDPMHGTIKWTPYATLASQWSVTALLRYLAGMDRKLLEHAELDVAMPAPDFEELAGSVLKSME